MRQRVENVMKSFFRTTTLKRRAFFFLTDTLFIALSTYLSFWLRFDGRIPPEYSRFLLIYILVQEIVLLSALSLLHCYDISWSFFSVRDAQRLFSALTSGSLILGIVVFFVRPAPAFHGYPRAVFITNYLMVVGFIGTLRISKRAIREYQIRRLGRSAERARTIIVGAGSAGEQIVREMLKNPRSRYYPLGFIDDDPSKSGVVIQGVKVLGSRKDLPALVNANHIDEVLIAMPSAPSKDIREIFGLIRECDEKTKINILPSIIDLVHGNVALKDIQEIKVEDLLGREPVEIDFQAIRTFLNGKSILVTGAGGSIGSELARTALQFNPAKLIVLDIDETELFYLINRLKNEFGSIIPVVADIRDEAKMEAVFSKYNPQVVLHSAAYKHVPIMEKFPEEAVKTNIFGTKLLAEKSAKYGVETFVNISTDKAINPTSVMGASKRIGEDVLRTSFNGGRVRFISVRFGNVLGSRGSVIPLFKDQIQRGGPVTVTNPEMKRYFMATSEAVLLVLQAAAVGSGGEVFVLDMGEPVKIDELAREMIRLSGHQPDVDIHVVYTGLRPGEKLFEELIGTLENSEATDHPKIFRVKNHDIDDKKDFREVLRRLEELSRGPNSKAEIMGLIQKMVPSYTPDRNGTTDYLRW